MKIERIGSMHFGVEGEDQFLLISPAPHGEETLTVEGVHDAMMTAYYRDTDDPGAYYCHRVEVIPRNSYGEFIAIVHHRFNV